MSKQAEEDYRALELYLKQAEEEIGLTLSGTFSPQDFCREPSEDRHGNNNNDLCTSDLTESTGQLSSNLDIESNTSSVNYQDKGEITDVSKLDLPGLTVDSGYSSQHSNDLENDLNIGISSTAAPVICYQYQGKITSNSKHDLAGLPVDSTPLNGQGEQAGSVDKHRNKTRAGDYHTNKTSLDGYHYIPEISEGDNYCFGDNDLVCNRVEVNDNQDLGILVGRGRTLHDNNWNLKELTAAIAEEIRVPDADRKKQDGDKNTDSEKLKVILGEWNDASDDSSSLEDDGVPLATCNLEDSVSLLSDASSGVVSLETTEFDQSLRSPSAKHRRLLSANECQVEVVVHDTTSIKNSLVDRNLSEDINVLQQEKLTQKCESDISVVNENIPNTKSQESPKNTQSRPYVKETIISKCSNPSKIETDISSTVENSSKKSVSLPLQQCTEKVDKDSNVCNDDSKPVDNRISVENSTANTVCSSILQSSNTSPDLVSSPVLQNTITPADLVHSPVLQGNNTSSDIVCSPGLQNNSTLSDSVCPPVLENSNSTTDVVCPKSLQSNSSNVCLTIPHNNISAVDVESSTHVDDTLMNSAVVGDHVKLESICLPVTKPVDELKDNRTVRDVQQVPNSVLVDFSKTRSGLIAESVLSPVEEDTSIPELCSPDIVDDSIKGVTENSLLSRCADTTDECDFRNTETQSDGKVYDNIHVKEVVHHSASNTSLDQDVGEEERCSTPTFIPSVDRTEQIISLTLNQHRILEGQKHCQTFPRQRNRRS